MRLLTTLFIFACALIANSKDVKSENDVYLFTSFSEPSIDGMKYLYSYDGLKWDTIPGIIMHPEVGNKSSYTDAFTGETVTPTFSPQRVLRDPSMVKGPDGTFHLVWTTQWTGSRGFGYASSKDLVHWSKQQVIPVMEDIPTNNVWAPEIFYEDETQEFYIIWSSQINPKEYTALDTLGANKCHRMYYTKTRDFKTFTPAKRYYDPGFNSIDGFLVKRAPKDYVLVVKDNRKPGFSNLFCVFSQSPEGPFSDPTPSFGRTFTEGPCVVRLDNGEWLVYYDQYHPQAYGASTTKDFHAFIAIPERISVPDTHKHGTIVRITRKQLEYILKTQKKR